jgi:hypothetical protein
MWPFKKKKVDNKMESKFLEIPVIRIGKPNSIGNVYTQESINDILEDFKEKASQIYGSIVGDQNFKTQDLSKITHVVEKIFIEDGFLLARARFFDTPLGTKAYEMLDQGLAMLRPTISGFVDSKTNEIIVHELVSFDILSYNDNVSETAEWIELK